MSHRLELSPRPNLEQQKNRAKEFHRALKAGEAAAIDRLRWNHPRFAHHAAGDVDAARVRLADAQWVIAREYGFTSWPALKRHIAAVRGRAIPYRAFETDPQYYRDRARGLASSRESGEREALRIIQRHHPAFAEATESEVAAAPFTQADAELVVAREHGFETFGALAAHAEALNAGGAREPFRDAFEAIKAGDAAAFERVLAAHPGLVNAQGSNGNRLLNLAVGLRRDAVADLLLERGADPGLGNDKGWTPLHDAVGGGGEDGALARLERLLAAGAPVEAEAHGEGGTPLAVALFWGRDVLAERLAREGVFPLNLRTAAGLGRAALMESLWGPSRGLRPEAGRSRGFYRPHSGFPVWRPGDDPQEILDEALTFAARNGRIEAMDWLVRRGAQVDAEPYRGTPLAWAVRMDRIAAIDWLIDHGAEVNRPSAFGGVEAFTPLHLAAAWDGRPRAAQRLLERGADIHALHAGYDATPLSTSRYFGNPEVEAVLEAWLARPD